jgi:hypothetical protein
MKIGHELIKTLAPFLPAELKEIIRSRISLIDYDIARQRQSNLFLNQNEMVFPNCAIRVGIVEEATQEHQHYVAACVEMSVSYKVIDLLANDWIECFRKEQFDVVLVWPCIATTVIKQVFDYRLHILERDFGVFIYPTWKECWLTEHKPRLRDWMVAHRLPHPQTWVFHDRDQAFDFVDHASLPIVSKTATGAGASGVNVIRNKPALKRIIHQAFGPGLRPRRYDAWDRQRGVVYFQEYLPDVEEWRMVRIGDSFFGYRKEKGADGLHSASHKWSWLDPGEKLLNLLKQVTEIDGFTSMDVDVFCTPDGRLLINELQTVFGCTTPAIYMKVNGIEGRYMWSDTGWKFQPGQFWQNHMCNLRLEYVLSRIAGIKRAF